MFASTLPIIYIVVVMEKMYRIIWVERLTLLDLCTLIIESYLTGTEIRYDEHRVSSSGKRLLRLIHKAGWGHHINPALLSLSVKDSSGKTLSYRMQKELKNISDFFCDSYLGAMPGWFKSMTKCFISSHLSSRVT